MIKNISISNFKSILHQEISFGRVNVFIGCNGAGKSNVLEAIGMLSAALSGEIQYDKLTARGVRLSAPDVFKSALKAQGKRKPNFTLNAQFDSLTYNAGIRARAEESSFAPFEFLSEILSHHGEKIMGRSPNSKKNVDMPPKTVSIVQYLEATGRLTEQQREAINAIKDFAIYAPSTPVLRGVASDESKKSPLGLYGGGLDRGFASLIKLSSPKSVKELFKLFDWVKSIGVRSPSKKIQSTHIHTPNKVVAFTDKYMNPAFNTLYAYDVSEGALYVFFVLLLLCLDDTPKIFALDNVDSALNPGMVRSLIEKIVHHSKENDRQVFMTTHNPTALDAVDIFDEDQRVFLVRRNNKTGETLIDRIRPPEGLTKDDWAEKYSGMKLSNLWIDGFFEGALPPNDL